MKIKFEQLSCVLLSALAAVPALRAELKLPAYMTDSMVVQRNEVLNIRGMADGAVKVSVSWSYVPYVALAESDGRFSMSIPTPSAGGPYKIEISDSNSRRVLSDVYSGELWLCSGQSNMEMPVGGWGKVLDYEQELASSTNPKVHLLQIKKTKSHVPSEEVGVNMSGWRTATPKSVYNFSAIAYFYARQLADELGVHVGVVDCTWSGTPGEAWTSLEGVRAVGGFEEKIRMLESADEDSIAMAVKSCNNPTVLYNGMIYPLRDMNIKGVLWYQGCGNVGRHVQYASLFRRMIGDWRRLWGKADMPFHFVQLASFQKPEAVQPSSAWAALRQAQADALVLPNTAMVTAIDLGDPVDIHPKNKQEVARRLCRSALRHCYGRHDIVAEAPVVESCRFDGRMVRLTFDAAICADGNPRGFIVKSADGTWSRPSAGLEGRDIVLVSYDSPIEEVRYNWADFPDGNIRGQGAALPVLPFKIEKNK